MVEDGRRAVAAGAASTSSTGAWRVALDRPRHHHRGGDVGALAVSAAFCVVGGGISGPGQSVPAEMAVGPHADITLPDPADRLGGILRTERWAGQPLDASVPRRSWPGGPKVPAHQHWPSWAWPRRRIETTGVRPLIYSGARLHPCRRGTLQGIPAQASSLLGLVDDATVARIFDERARPFSWRPQRPIQCRRAGRRQFSIRRAAVGRSRCSLARLRRIAATIGLRSRLPRHWRPHDRGARSLTDAVRAALPRSAGFGVRRARRRLRGAARQCTAGVNWVQVAAESVSTAAAAAGRCSTTRARAGRRTRWCWPFPRPGCRNSSSTSPAHRVAAAQSHRSRRRPWWRSRCLAAHLFRNSRASWWLRANREAC